MMLTALGLMSGTSLDGVDAAIIQTDGETIGARGPALSLPYPTELRQRARSLLDRASDLPADDQDLLDIERALTEHHISAVRQLAAQVPSVDVIGFHGQTLYHAPAERRTWQIGDARLLSRATGLPVVHDFRSADVAIGGEGAPLAPWYHAGLLRESQRPVAVLNIGGVANISFLAEDGTIYACDTGPGNALLDDWAFRHTGVACDVDGQLAKQGNVQRDILESLLQNDYFSKPIPKSLDRLTFSAALDAVASCSPADGMATLAAFTVEAVKRTSLPGIPTAWYVCGGGRHNPVLMEGLQRALEGVVEPVEVLGWDGDALEAECFGFLAVRVLRNLPLSCKTITGAPQDISGGRLTCDGLSPVPQWMAPR